ncbi:protein kinase, partial [Actinotalea ferrariae]|uniref:protein kinase domain-containing protein n=1 Tax=Actinotalea ferrariae TaxID=1386098 RepID=UPI001C8C3D77
MTFETPEGLAATLLDLGLHLGVPLGSGSRGVVWSAVDGDGARWAVSVLVVRSAMHAARLEERAARLSGVEHEHLARVGAAFPLPDGRLAVLHRAVEGTDLATLHRAREQWSPGEVVTVLVPLAGALDALHAAGLAHGDVSPANVVISDGRPVLIDVLTGDDPLEQGTPGFAAPERHRGARPPGDVHALARLGLALLGHATDDPRAAALAAVLAAACGPDPD